MGVTVRERDGAWWLYIHHKRVRKARRVGDREAAEKAATTIRAHLAAGDLTCLNSPPPQAVATFATYATTWLQTAGRQTCKHSTVAAYQSTLTRHAIPALGSKSVAAISRADLRALIAACREKGLSPKSIGNISRTVSVILSQALEDGLISSNPAFRLGRHIRQGDHIKPEIRPFTREETAQFLQRAKELTPREYPLFLTALRTGMRLGELLGLEWQDVNFEGRFIEVRRNRVAGRVTTPKNGKSRRIDMSSQLSQTLTTLRQQRSEALPVLRPPAGPVFCTERGTALGGDNLRHRVFYKLLAAASLRRVRFHDLRHTFATLLIQNGESLAYIRDQLGHSSIQLTVDTYGHLIPGTNRQAVDRLDDASAW